MSSIHEQIDEIALHVGRHGIDRSERHLRRLASIAVHYQVLPAIVSLLTDTTAPDVVRSRAFARIVVGLRALPPRPLSAAA